MSHSTRFGGFFIAFDSPRVDLNKQQVFNCLNQRTTNGGPMNTALSIANILAAVAFISLFF